MEKKRFQVDKYLADRRKKDALLIVSIILLVVLAMVSLLIGQYGISPLEAIRILLGDEVQGYTSATIQNIIMNIRVPRTIISILVGASLSIAGISYQCVFRNMLVSQDVLGVSTGCCVGAAAAIVMGWSTMGIQALAFVGGIGSVMVVWMLSKLVRAEKTLSLILAGVLVSGLMSSVLGWIKYTANQETQLPNIVYWIMGDLSSVTIEQIQKIAMPMVLCVAVIMLNTLKLNYFAYSDSEAMSIGVNISLYRTIFIICSTLLVSLAVSVSGSIGWIGLVIPQLARTLVNTNNRDAVPLALVLGADFLLLVDILNRLVSTAELPISILTGMIGTPLFVMCLLIKQRKENDEIRC